MIALHTTIHLKKQLQDQQVRNAVFILLDQRLYHGRLCEPHISSTEGKTKIEKTTGYYSFSRYSFL